MANPNYDLVILAAGVGSRFGGVKQVQPVGPHGELIIEYSVFDALRAGFTRLVLVIRREMEVEFRAAIGRRLERRIEVRYAYQEAGLGEERLAALGVSAATVAVAARQAERRVKPWGTGHAVLAARREVEGPFAVINADDFYGASAYSVLAAHFARTGASLHPEYALVGFPLSQTLSDHGSVSRGLCETTPSGRLQRITEVTRIEKTATGARYTDAQGESHRLTGAETVSMNFWGLTPEVFPQLERLFGEFLGRCGEDAAAEFYLPTALSTLNERREAVMTLLTSADAWFGLTYRADLAAAQAAIAELVTAGRYPSPLWT